MRGNFLGQSNETPYSEPKTITTTAENVRSVSINLQIQEVNYFIFYFQIRCA
jgi:hypothetical protein